MSHQMQSAGPGPSGGGGGGGKPRARGRKAQKRATFPYINSQIISVAEMGDFDSLVVTIEEYLSQMNLVNISTAMHRLAKLVASNNHLQLVLRSHPVLNGLLTTARGLLAKAEASASPPQCQALSNITWSLATVQCVDLELLQTAARLSYKHVPSFKPFELSAALWAYAKLDSLSREACECALPLFEAAADHIMTNVHDFSFRCLVMSAWAFATARYHDERLFRLIGQQMLISGSAASSSVQTAQCQELANAAWAFSTAGVREEKLFTELAKKAIRSLPDFKPQELANIMWAFASSGFFKEDFFVASAQISQTMELQPQQIANVLWAVSRIRPHHRVTASTILALLPRCTVAIAEFKPQELASVALAAAKCFGKGAGDPQDPTMPGDRYPIVDALPPEVYEFFMAVLPWVAGRLPYFSSQSLANIATSFLAVQQSLGSQVSSYNLYGSVAMEVQRRLITSDPLAKIENGALLLLLRNLPAAPRAACGQAVCLLFEEAYRRVTQDTLNQKELLVLSKLCVSLLGLPRSRVLEKPDLAAICRELGLERSWAPSDPWQAPAEGMRVNNGGLDVQSLAPGTSSPPLLKVSGGPVAGGLHGSVVSSSLDPSDSPGASNDAVGGDESVLGTRINYSVKHTFVDFEEADASDTEVVTIPLPPPLHFIPSDVPPEKLEEYRMNYQKFRAGDAVGAKGELSTVTALDSLDLAQGLGAFPQPIQPSEQALSAFVVSSQPALGRPLCPGLPLPSSSALEDPLYLNSREAQPSGASSSTSAQSVGKKAATAFTEENLPPPLACMPKFIDLGKLATFRTEYQKFRAGNANGAKGEISTTTRIEEDEELTQADEEWLKRLPPPLPHLPPGVSSRKLAAYRVQYQKFRAGESSGAKGEVARVVYDEHGRASAPAAAIGTITHCSSRSSFEGNKPSSQASASPPVNFSVKNTFVHIDDPEQEEEGEEEAVVKLPPSLPIIPDSISPDALDAYRTDYQKFRAGKASGAKGEVSNLAALDLVEAAQGDSSET